MSKIKIGTVIGRYRLESLISRGGQATVYVAEKLDVEDAPFVFERWFALKLEDKSDIRTDRWEFEVNTLRGVEHPSIVRVHDAGFHGAWWLYTVMSLLQGETLFARLERGSLPLLDALLVAAEVGCGLAAVHAVGLVHRDVKPENIMLAPSGAVLFDFGSGKQEGAERESVPAQRPRTARYAAPELHLEAAPLDPRSDTYSLGLVLHHAISGAVPWGRGEGIGVIQLMMANTCDELPLLSDVPAEVAALVAEMAVKPREQRPDMMLVVERLISAARHVARQPAPPRLSAGEALYDRTREDVGRATERRITLKPSGGASTTELLVLGEKGEFRGTVPRPPPSGRGLALEGETTTGDKEPKLQTALVGAAPTALPDPEDQPTLSWTPRGSRASLARLVAPAPTVAEPSVRPVEATPASTRRSSLLSAMTTTGLRDLVSPGRSGWPATIPPVAAVLSLVALVALLAVAVVAASVFHRRALAAERALMSAALVPTTAAVGAAPTVAVSTVAAPAVPVPSPAALAVPVPSATGSGARSPSDVRRARTRAPKPPGAAPSASGPPRAPFQLEKE